MIFKKLRSRRGMTLAETLTALAVFVILSVALVVGTTAAWKVYQKSVVASESRALRSTLTQALGNELRYSQNVRTDAEGKVVFDSAVFGMDVSVISDTANGRIKIGKTGKGGKSYDLLPDKTYTKGLKAEASVDYKDGYFTVTLTVKHDLLPAEGSKTIFNVRALNNNT